MRNALGCVAVLLAVASSLTACENGAQNMYDQAKYKPQAESELWRDGRAARPLQPETVAYSGGDFADSSSGRASRSDPGSEPETPANIYSIAAMERGRNRYDIFCVPCHGAVGDGDGYITRRGFPHPPTFHSDKLRGAPDQHFFNVMSKGYGAMYPYADRITAQDRWAIVGYVRALQRSQHASVDDLPPTQRNQPGSPKR